MMKSSVAAQMVDPAQPISREFFKGRYVKNCGTNTVTINADLNFFHEIFKYKTEPIYETVLKPGEYAWLKNFFIIVETDDGKPALLPQSFNKEGLVTLNADYLAGKFR